MINDKGCELVWVIFNDMIELSKDEAKFFDFALRVEDGEYGSVTFRGSGSTSNVVSDDMYAYKLPRVHLDEDLDENYFENDFDYEAEYYTLRDLEDLRSFVDPVAFTDTLLITKLVQGFTLEHPDSISYRELKDHHILLLAEDLRKAWDRGYVPLDINATNIILDRETDRLVVIDVGEFVKRTRVSYTKHQPMPLFFELLMEHRPKFNDYLTSIFKGEFECYFTQ